MQRSKREELIGFIENKNIDQKELSKVLKLSGISPTAKAWYTFLSQTLLWFAGLSLAFSVMFFVAFNWTEFGRFEKFAMLEGLMLLTMLIYWFKESDALVSKVLLLVLSILLGVLLALFGQTYQTGADPWQLFFYWALLMLPWAFVGRFSALWMLWIFLVNLSIVLYMDTFGRFFSSYFYDDSIIMWIFFSFNALALLVWELGSKRFEWLNASWATGILGLVSGALATALAFSSFWGESSAYALLAWATWMAAVFYAYRVVKIDLFMMAIFCFSFSSVLVYMLLTSSQMGNFDLGFIFVIGLVIIGLGAVSAKWLKALQKEATNAI